MADKKIVEPKARAPLRQWIGPVALAWIVPGGGHLLLGKRGRGAILASCVILTYAMGLLMRGTLFQPQFGDILTTIIYTGGFIGNVAAGLPYLLTVWLGYNQPDVAGHVYDYGTKFLVAAGLLNVLAMVDAFEIAVGKKD